MKHHIRISIVLVGLVAAVLAFGTPALAQKGKPTTNCSVPDPIPNGGYCFSGAPGCLDTSFGGGTGRVLAPMGLRILGLANQTVASEQRIVAVGIADAWGNDPCVEYGGLVVRYRMDGTLDVTFGTGGIVKPGVRAEGVVVQPDNKLIVVGTATTQVPPLRGNKPLTVDVPAVARLNEDGSLDSTFGTGGIVKVPYGSHSGSGYAVALQSDGKIVLAGTYSPRGIAVIRLNPNGTLDTTFNGTGQYVHTSTRSAGNGVTLQTVASEERIVVAGQMEGAYLYDSAVLLRLTSTGALDVTFGGTGVVITDWPPPPEGGYNGSNFEDVAVDSSNRIVAAGDMPQNCRLARFDPSGSLDTTFGTGGFACPQPHLTSDSTRATAIQPDGYIFAVGTSWLETSTSFRPFMGVWRFTPDGAVDTTFGDSGWIGETFTTNGGGFGFSVVLQPDGKVMVGGNGPGGRSYWTAGLARYWR